VLCGKPCSWQCKTSQTWRRPHIKEPTKIVAVSECIYTKTHSGRGRTGHNVVMNPFISRMRCSLFYRFKRMGGGGGLIGPVCQGGGGSPGLPLRNLSQIHTQWQSVTLQSSFFKFIKGNSLTKNNLFLYETNFVFGETFRRPFYFVIWQRCKLR
jgi:hypothetical protein